MNIQFLNQTKEWQITVDNEVRLIAEDWEEVNFYMQRLLLPLPEVRDMTAYEFKQALVDAGEGEE
tara:strand:+ start:428 stop:622 length:195 start_codon:yes stop_codon:yes gene_type:complete